MRTTTSSRVRSRQRRIVALAAGPVLIAGMALAVSFTNSFADGTQIAGVRVNHADYVWPVNDNAPMPFLDVTDLAVGGRALPGGSTITMTEGDASASKVVDWRYPSWTVEDPANGPANATVDIEGDVALIDARGAEANSTGTGNNGPLGTPRSTTVGTTPKDFTLNRDNLKAIKVNMFIENMNQMQEAYDSYYLPITVYKWDGEAAVPAWAPVTRSEIGQSSRYLHSLDGTMSFTFPACKKCFYAITMPQGGNLHVNNQAVTGTSTTVAGAQGTVRPVVAPRLFFTSSAINYSNSSAVG